MQIRVKYVARTAHARQSCRVKRRTEHAAKVLHAQDPLRLVYGLQKPYVLRTLHARTVRFSHFYCTQTRRSSTYGRLCPSLKATGTTGRTARLAVRFGLRPRPYVFFTRAWRTYGISACAVRPQYFLRTANVVINACVCRTVGECSLRSTYV